VVKNLFVLLVALNILFLDGYLLYKEYFKEPESQPEKITTLVKENAELVSDKDGCGDECKNYIDEKFDKLNENTADAIPTAMVQRTPTTVTLPKVKNVSYLPIPGSGSTLANDWTSINGTDFYLSKNDYPGLTGVYLEVNMKLTNGNGMAFVRLYDATHGIGVVGSELKTSNQTSTFVTSGNLSLWEGYNHYQIQVKSLTADTAVYESGRLKIFTEN